MLFVEISGKPCPKCGTGVYQETSLKDEINGVVHCTNCDDEQPSVIEESEPDDRFTLYEEDDMMDYQLLN